jgi:hypothetical protein
VVEPVSHPDLIKELQLRLRGVNIRSHNRIGGIFRYAQPMVSAGPPGKT